MDEPEHLQGLNPEQHRAVSAIGGPCLVLAGAGSGKTRVLTRRIAHLLHSGVSPSHVIALTFTNKAANEMRERVAELVGPQAERLWVSTFHSTAARILRTDIEPLGFTRRFAIYDDDDQMRLLKGIVHNAGYDDSRVDVRDIASKIDGYKNRMKRPDEVLDERRSHIGDALIRVWVEYEEALKAADALDFNDLLGHLVRLFTEHPDVLAKWRERFQYVLVDEYQDTNRVQYQLLRLLCAEHRNLAVVGDDDQSIYGFRGAEISNILDFQRDYPDATVVRLEQNYRSTGNILALANAVVKHNADRLPKELWTSAQPGPRVQLMVAGGPREEGMRVAEAILRLRRMGHRYDEVAIIYRTNAIARHFEAGLRAMNIPHKVVGGRKFYERREVRDLLAYLRVLVNPADDAAFLRVVNVPPRGVGTKTQAELRADAAKVGQPLLATARARGGPRSPGEKGIAAFVRVVDELLDLARDLPLAPLVTEVCDRSGYRAMLSGDVDKDGNIDSESQERLRNLDALIADAAAHEPAPEARTPMEQLVGWLDRIALSADADEAPEGGQVTLMTVHSSKGLEFPFVFVVMMNDGIFPHERSAETALDEERRLAYVAFTRAMTRLIITRSLTDVTGGTLEPSRFLFGVPEAVLDGDLPSGSAVEGERQQREREARESQSKIRTFLQARQDRLAVRQPSAGHLPDVQYTLLEVESLEQLTPGVSILHPQFGVGTIRQVLGNRLQVAFTESARWVTATSQLRIVSE
jgi:DNA helicase II / ATP-dependent DNA helicase PcrA